MFGYCAHHVMHSMQKPLENVPGSKLKHMSYLPFYTTIQVALQYEGDHKEEPTLLGTCCTRIPLKIFTVDLMVPAVRMLFVCVAHGYILSILIMHLVSSQRQLLHMATFYVLLDLNIRLVRILLQERKQNTLHDLNRFCVCLTQEHLT